jgi:hypothetical protein
MASISAVIGGSEGVTTSKAMAPVLPPRTSLPVRQPVLEAEALLLELTTRQHLHPRSPLGTVLVETRACPVAAQRAMEWLGLDGATAVGRIKRAELIQLARSLHRFWKRAAASDPAAQL